MQLPDRNKSHAFLVGVASYKSSLQNMPAANNNVTDLAQIFTDPFLGRISPANCTVVRNPNSPAELNKLLTTAAREATDTFVFYYAGHGLVGDRDDLYLALTNTDRNDLRHTALNYEAVRDAFRNCPATRRIAIVDCCFSGRIISQYMSDKQQFVHGQVDVQGVYNLTSTSPNNPAYAPKGAAYTEFTGELISILRTGIVGAPEFITFNYIFPRLVQALRDKGKSTPHQSGTDTVTHLAFARNAAFVPARSDTESSTSGSDASTENEVTRSEPSSSLGWLDEIDTHREPVFANPLEFVDYRPAFGGHLAWAAVWTACTFCMIPTGWPLGWSIAVTLAGWLCMALLGSSPFASTRRKVGIATTIAVVCGYAIATIPAVRSDRWLLLAFVIFQALLLIGLAIAFGVLASESRGITARLKQTRNSSLRACLRSSDVDSVAA
jgi:hypothetical protein